MEKSLNKKTKRFNINAVDTKKFFYIFSSIFIIYLLSFLLPYVQLQLLFLNFKLFLLISKYFNPKNY